MYLLPKPLTSLQDFYLCYVKMLFIKPYGIPPVHLLPAWILVLPEIAFQADGH